MGSKKIRKAGAAPLGEKSIGEINQHTIKNPRNIEERVRRAMKLAGYKDFTAFALTAQVARCRQIELEHGIDSDGNPLPPAAK